MPARMVVAESPAPLVDMKDEPELIKPWLELDLMSWWIEFGIRQFEDLLLVHAAFQREYPDENRD